MGDKFYLLMFSWLCYDKSGSVNLRILERMKVLEATRKKCHRLATVFLNLKIGVTFLKLRDFYSFGK